MASVTDIKKKVGQLFLVGFDGLTVPDEFAKFMVDYGLGGTIYFKRNVETPAQLAELSNEIQFTCRPKDIPPLFISIDHEGGKVNRLVKPFTKFPGMENLGELNSPKVCFEFGQVLARELLAVGININYAPVVDVLTNPKNPVMAQRTFSSDPEVCGRMGSAVCRGLQKMGVMAVAKHFPGHGDTDEDSHFTLPKVTKTYEQLDAMELIPFKRVIRSRVDGIMTAHILNPELDDVPATLSKKTLDILRNELRYTKLIFSDDMEMKAVADNYGGEEAAVQALKAGCDQLIYRGDPGPPIKDVEAVIKAYTDGVIPMDDLDRKIARIEHAKKTYCSIEKPVEVTEVSKNIGLPDHFKLADIILKKEIPEGMFEA